MATITNAPGTLATAERSTPRRAAGKRPRVTWDKLLIWIVLGIGAIIMVAPFYWTVITSFKTTAETRALPPTWIPQEWTTENWKAVSGRLDYGGSLLLFFGNSLFVCTIITVFTIFTSALCGYVFAKFNFRGKRILFWTVLSMLMVPASVTLLPLFDMVVSFGWKNNYLALIVPIIFSPFGIFLMRQQMMNIPSELIDAARIDGSTEYGIFFKIILPNAKAAIAALAIFTFAFQWDNFQWPLIVLDRVEQFTVPLGLSLFRGRNSIAVGPVAAASIATILPVLIVYFFAQRRFVEGIALTGMKG